MSIVIAIGALGVLVLLLFAVSRVQNRLARVGLTVAIPVALITFGFWWIFLRPNEQLAVWVNRISSGGSTTFAIDIPSTSILITGSSNTFRPLVSVEELFAAMQQQHPGTIVKGQVAQVVEDNVGYVLHPSEYHAGAYTLALETISFSRGDTSYDLPFPYLQTKDVIKETGVIVSDCDVTCLAKYYKPFSNVTRDGQGFIIKVPGSRFQLTPREGGYTVKLL